MIAIYESKISTEIEQMSENRGPLYGLRVVDLTDIRGSLCARFLADLGADVLRIPNCEADENDTWEHRFRNANKRRLNIEKTFEISDENNRKQLLEVLEHSDVFIENLGPKLLKEHDLLTLTDKFPNLVHISISDFGLSGPHSEWRLEPLPAFSSSGAHEVSGFPDLPPCWLPGFVAHDCASAIGAIGAVAAIMDRRRTDSGQLVEVSVQEAALNGLNPWSMTYEKYSKTNPYLPANGGRFADATYWVLPAKDGWVRIVIGSRAHWEGFLEVVGRPEALLDPEWRVLGFRAQNADAARLIANSELSKKTKLELFESSQEAGTMLGPIHTLEEFMEHPQTKFREFFVETGWEAMEDAPMAAFPWKLTKSPASLRLRAPNNNNSAVGWLDEEDENFCPISGVKFLDYTANPEKRTNGSSTPKSQLLEGIRIIEFGAAAVVPEMCWMLDELGAEVIKIESRTSPDILRTSESGNLDERFAFNAECRGRKSVALDLRSERGKEIAFELCAGADIVAENFRGGSVDSFGLSYEALSAANPKLIYISSQGFGRGGPLGETAAFGPINLAFAGIHALWNHSEENLKDRYPCGTSLNHPDHVAGKILAIAVLAAIDYRARTGEGQMIDMSQAEAGAYIMGHFYMDKEIQQSNGNQSIKIVPHDTYPCAGQDNWISIVAKNDEEFANLAKVIGGGYSTKWQTGQARLKQRDEIDKWIKEWTQTQDPMDATRQLQEAGVSAMMVQGPKEHHADPHLSERKYIVELEHPVVGSEDHTGNPLNMTKTKVKEAGAAPCLGADTEKVLTQILGLEPAEVQQLIDEKICW